MHTGGHVAGIGNLAIERPRATSIGFGRVTLVAEELGVDARAPLNRFRAGGLFRWLRDVWTVGRNRWERRSAPSLNASKLAGPRFDSRVAMSLARPNSRNPPPSPMGISTYCSRSP